jgi:hypothetical protein
MEPFWMWWVKLVHIWEDPGSDLELETSYHDRFFVVLFSLSRQILGFIYFILGIFCAYTVFLNLKT